MKIEKAASASTKVMDGPTCTPPLDDFHQRPLLGSASHTPVLHPHVTSIRPGLPLSSLRNVSTIPPTSDEADLTDQESSVSDSGSSHDAEGTDSETFEETESEDEEDVSPALGRTFSGHAAFERYAVGLLQASHENAVVERKRQ
jgi:hypothetical protein